jgi:ATP-dependent protease HslVU (ClpYQ) peptidase subunit
MSCVVGIMNEKQVIIGGDSATTSGSTIQIDACPKIFGIKTKYDEYFIGHVGSGKIGNALRHTFFPPRFKDGDLEHYIATYFIDALKKCFNRAGFGEHGADLLIGFRSRLFWIGEDYQIGQPANGYTAIGSGEDYALGALFATQFLDPPLDLEKRVLIALEAAAEHNVYVRPPFIVSSRLRGEAS